MLWNIKFSDKYQEKNVVGIINNRLTKRKNFFLLYILIYSFNFNYKTLKVRALAVNKLINYKNWNYSIITSFDLFYLIF